MGNMLSLGQAAGLVPDFEKYSEAEISSLLTTGTEVLRMIRDGDPNSYDPRAERVYAGLFPES